MHNSSEFANNIQYEGKHHLIDLDVNCKMMKPLVFLVPLVELQLTQTSLHTLTARIHQQAKLKKASFSQLHKTHLKLIYLKPADTETST